MAAKKEPAVQPAAASDKKKALETAMQQIEKMYGKGSIMRYGAESTLNVEAIPTGSWRSTDRSPPVRPRWPSMCWRRPRRWAARWPL